MGAVVGAVPVKPRSVYIDTNSQEAASDFVGTVSVGIAGRSGGVVPAEAAVAFVGSVTKEPVGAVVGECSPCRGKKRKHWRRQSGGSQRFRRFNSSQISRYVRE